MAVKEDANEAPDPSKQWQEEVGALYDLVSTAPRVIFQEAGFVPVLPEPVLRGQLPIVRQDFFLLPEVFGSPDAVENGGKTKPGRDMVRYSKTIGEVSYHYIEELRTKKTALRRLHFTREKLKKKLAARRQMHPSDS